MMQVKVLGAAAAMAAFVGLSSAGTAWGLTNNLVENSGFETGDLTDYTSFGNFSATGLNGVSTHNSSGDAFSGTYFLELGNYPGQGIAGVSQTLSTVAGQTYDVSLEFENGGGNPAGAQLLEVLWNGSAIATIDGQAPTNGYELLSYRAVGTGSDVLSVEGYSTSGFDNIDNLSVTAAAAVSAVPEPGAWLLMIAGFGGAGLMLRQNKRKREFGSSGLMTA